MREKSIIMFTFKPERMTCWDDLNTDSFPDINYQKMSYKCDNSSKQRVYLLGNVIPLSSIPTTESFLDACSIALSKDFHLPCNLLDDFLDNKSVSIGISKKDKFIQTNFDLFMPEMKGKSFLLIPTRRDQFHFFPISYLSMSMEKGVLRRIESLLNSPLSVIETIDCGECHILRESLDIPTHFDETGHQCNQFKCLCIDSILFKDKKECHHIPISIQLESLFRYQSKQTYLTFTRQYIERDDFQINDQTYEYVLPFPTVDIEWEKLDSLSQHTVKSAHDELLLFRHICLKDYHCSGRGEVRNTMENFHITSSFERSFISTIMHEYFNTISTAQPMESGNVESELFDDCGGIDSILDHNGSVTIIPIPLINNTEDKNNSILHQYCQAILNSTSDSTLCNPDCVSITFDNIDNYLNSDNQIKQISRVLHVRNRLREYLDNAFKCEYGFGSRYSKHRYRTKLLRPGRLHMDISRKRSKYSHESDRYKDDGLSQSTVKDVLCSLNQDVSDKKRPLETMKKTDTEKINEENFVKSKKTQLSIISDDRKSFSSSIPNDKKRKMEQSHQDSTEKNSASIIESEKRETDKRMKSFDPKTNINQQMHASENIFDIFRNLQSKETASFDKPNLQTIGNIRFSRDIISPTSNDKLRTQTIGLSSEDTAYIRNVGNSPKILISDDLIEINPRLMTTLKQKYNIFATDCALIHPIDAVIDFDIAISFLHKVKLTDPNYLKDYLKGMIKNIFKFSVIWIAVIQCHEDIGIDIYMKFLQSLSQFPIKLIVRDLIDSESDSIPYSDPPSDLQRNFIRISTSSEKEEYSHVIWHICNISYFREKGYFGTRKDSNYLKADVGTSLCLETFSSTDTRSRVYFRFLLSFPSIDPYLAVTISSLFPVRALAKLRVEDIQRKIAEMYPMIDTNRLNKKIESFVKLLTLHFGFTQP